MLIGKFIRFRKIWIRQILTFKFFFFQLNCQSLYRFAFITIIWFIFKWESRISYLKFFYSSHSTSKPSSNLSKIRLTLQLSSFLYIIYCYLKTSKLLIFLFSVYSNLLNFEPPTQFHSPFSFFTPIFILFYFF